MGEGCDHPCPPTLRKPAGVKILSSQFIIGVVDRSVTNSGAWHRVSSATHAACRGCRGCWTVAVVHRSRRGFVGVGIRQTLHARGIHSAALMAAPQVARKVLEPRERAAQLQRRRQRRAKSARSVARAPAQPLILMHKPSAHVCAVKRGAVPTRTRARRRNQRRNQRRRRIREREVGQLGGGAGEWAYLAGEPRGML